MLVQASLRGSALEKDTKEMDMIVAALRRAVYVRIMERRVKERYGRGGRRRHRGALGLYGGSQTRIWSRTQSPPPQVDGPALLALELALDHDQGRQRQ